MINFLQKKTKIVLFFIICPILFWIILPKIPTISVYLIFPITIFSAIIATPITAIFCKECANQMFGGFGYMIWIMFVLIFLITFIIPSVIYIQTNKKELIIRKAVVLLLYLFYLIIFAVIFSRYTSNINEQDIKKSNITYEETIRLLATDLKYNRRSFTANKLIKTITIENFKLNYSSDFEYYDTRMYTFFNTNKKYISYVGSESTYYMLIINRDYRQFGGIDAALNFVLDDIKSKNTSNTPISINRDVDSIKLTNNGEAYFIQYTKGRVETYKRHDPEMKIILYYPLLGYLIWNSRADFIGANELIKQSVSTVRM